MAALSPYPAGTVGDGDRLAGDSPVNPSDLAISAIAG
jgi:hypothetical protein